MRQRVVHAFSVALFSRQQDTFVKPTDFRQEISFENCNYTWFWNWHDFWASEKAMTIVFSMGTCYLWSCIFIFICVWQAISKYFIHLLWDLLSLILFKKPPQLPKFLSLKFRKGKNSQKLRVGKENVSVKNTGTKILLQFSGENPKGGPSGRSNNSWKGAQWGEKETS